jgi:competence protein ComEC
MSLRQASLQNSAISKVFGQSVQITAQVITDPSQTITGNFSFIARAIYLKSEVGSFSMRIPIRVITPRNQVLGLLPGQSFSADARILQSKEARVGALVLIDEEVEVLTPPSRWAKALGAIRSGLR